jgi:23S rRNA maturation-related 3'-5' exoribonuclease YhaM
MVRDYKAEFKSLVAKYIHREGIEELMESLEKSDFYVAPASTRYHDSEEHGLVKHSIKVFDWLMKDYGDVYDHETIAIVSLFHDVCKIGFYKIEMRNAKNEKGNWEKVPYYTIDDQLPINHACKSVIMLQQLIKLNNDEILAICSHMGLSEPKENYNTISKAFTDCPLALALHFSDMKSTYINE